MLRRMILELFPDAAKPVIDLVELLNLEDAKAVEVPPHVGANFSLDSAERLVPVFTTLIAPYVAEFGIVTDSELDVALVTVALAAPK